MSKLQQLVEIKAWNRPGYQPLVFSDGWQVALLNYERGFDLANLEVVERHKRSDEAFVLIRGEASLVVGEGAEGVERLELVEMEKGAVYSVIKGVWHNLLASHDASWIIVEDRDTHLHDVEYHELSAASERGFRTTSGIRPHHFRQALPPGTNRRDHRPPSLQTRCSSPTWQALPQRWPAPLQQPS